ncbi:hypothetical protein [Pseudomonas rubra]|uniref:Uncharacterized protein n=1 Tax=Pseudomonas rubra TaxID=2942627 RepID=A0ABT5PCH5_9PSED|nr:hypothetical protein [Pseudomonas rubra]MDD1015907.1 hypothetical protein [Pseudomonas rubra]MDD1039322.1 hypothetical protein [Pseudomonas rubra]MDD1155292.1 hypothetical protein [Pseudomonas rubra]
MHNIPPALAENVGLFWYTDAEQYRNFLSIYVDAKAMHDTYAEWQRDALDLEIRLRNSGRVTIRVCSTPEEFKTWCRASGLPLNGKSRARFVNHKIGSGTVKTASLQDEIRIAHHGTD